MLERLTVETVTNEERLTLGTVNVDAETVRQQLRYRKKPDCVLVTF